MKICRYCGSIYSGEEKYCALCGCKLEEQTEPKRSLCVMSLLFAILGCMMLLPVVSPVISLCAGKAALRQGDDKLAKAGVAISVVTLSLTVLLAILITLSLLF